MFVRVFHQFGFYYLCDMIDSRVLLMTEGAGEWALLPDDIKMAALVSRIFIS